MSMLELISKAVANRPDATQSEYPIVLNPDDCFANLKPEVENPDPTLLAIPVSGWQISAIDSKLIDLNKEFYTELNQKLEDSNNFTKDVFVGILRPFLEKIAEVVSCSVVIDSSDNGYTRAMMEKVGSLIGRDAVGLVVDASVKLEMWDLLESMIANKIVVYLCFPTLVASLVTKRRSDLLCLCIKHAPDLGLNELLSILKYFLCPSKDARSSMVNVMKEWEKDLMSAIRMVNEESLSGEKLQVAKDACVLLMVACDGFSMPELCLHYLLASSNMDEVIFSSAVGKLNGKEIMSLIRYLGKWLKKYEKFPQAVPCPKASSMLGLKTCDWVPKLEDVLRSLGLVLDEDFSSLVLHSEFHEELKSMQRLVVSMSSEAKICCLVSNVIENLKNEAKSKES